MDINLLRSLATVFCMVGILAVTWWAFGPSRKSYFDKAAQLPFEDGDDHGDKS